MGAIAESIGKHLEVFCTEITDRHVGSAGNQRAAEYFAQEISVFGFSTECPSFECIDWESGDVEIGCDGAQFGALPGPYSLACSIAAPLIVVSTVEELEQLDTPGSVLLMRGPLARVVEIVAFNGEDYYAASGQMLYLKDNADSLKSIMLAINIDGAGYKDHPSEFSLYDVPEALSLRVRDTLSLSRTVNEGPLWYQSDHMVFAMHGTPAMAVTSRDFMSTLAAEITHTPHDTLDKINIDELARIAVALSDLIVQLVGAH